MGNSGTRSGDYSKYFSIVASEVGHIANYKAFSPTLKQSVANDSFRGGTEIASAPLLLFKLENW
jgi:hypothetical protein